MDKKLIMKIIVVAAALLFITSSFRLPSGPKGNNILSGENITGYITFNGTIRTYDPLLVITGTLNESVLNMVRELEGVSSVRLDQQNYFIDTETRDDVYPIAQMLREMNISTLSVANIAAPSVMQLQFGTEMLNVTSQGVVRVATEPFLDAGDDVTVTMIGISNNGILIDYHSGFIQIDAIALEMEAEVQDLNHMTYIYMIPWEERNSVSDEAGDYKKIDTLLFNPPLSMGQVMIKKQFPYITYIDASSAQVLPEFDNKSQVLSNFQDASVTFPDSILTITTNESHDLSYDSTVTYSYNLLLSVPEGYELSENEIVFESDEELEGTVTLEVDALVTGTKIISVESVSLPS